MHVSFIKTQTNFRYFEKIVPWIFVLNIVYFPIGRYHIDVDRLKTGVIDIDIELKDRNRLKEFFQNFHSKAEDLLFTIIQKLPERIIPSALMEWLNRYLDKRISKLKQESIKTTWQTMYLQSAVDQIKMSDK